eukprot:m.56569 g.56569  ORF g.56569 m.56569 type:complete len:143 (-) comp7804_c0_seq1:3353-3781(-)
MKVVNNSARPRKGAFEVTVCGEVSISLLDLPRPFKQLRELDMEWAAKTTLELIKKHAQVDGDSLEEEDDKGDGEVHVLKKAKKEPVARTASSAKHSVSQSSDVKKKNAPAKAQAALDEVEGESMIPTKRVTRSRAKKASSQS